MGSASALRRHPEESALLPSQLRNPLLYDDVHHPLLSPDILAVVLACLDIRNDYDNDEADENVRNIAQATVVCRQWWHGGHRLLWRRVQLRSLLTHVNDPKRRSHYASLVEKLYFKPNDTTLATEEISQAALTFPRLRSVDIYESNILHVRRENLAALMVPTLQFWHVDDDYLLSETDNSIYFNAFLAGCGVLTHMSFNTCGSSKFFSTVLTILGSLKSIEQLSLGSITLDLVEKHPPEDFLYSMLADKPRLSFIDLHAGHNISQPTVEQSLADMGRKWSIPSLQTFQTPSFDSGMAVARLISRMPNLTGLSFSISRWNNDLDCAFAAVSMLEKLKTLDLEIGIYNCDMDGSSLVHLVRLKSLKNCWLYVGNPGNISLTVVHLASILSVLPQLGELSIGFGPLMVPCTVEQYASINHAAGKTDETQLVDMSFIIRKLQ